MVHIFIRHAVRDYAAWKQVFDDDADNRAIAGEQKWWVSHILGDPRNLALWLEWDSTENAQKFFQSPRLKDRMIMSGVIGEPEIFMMEEVARGESRHLAVR